MFGENPKRGVASASGASLEIKSIFSTLQGEGVFAGHPAIFVRLGGCNLACDFCDTEFEDFETMSLDEIISKVQSFKGLTKANLIVITGGEPMRQNIAPICAELISLGYQVQIETNGTLYRDLHEDVSIICSPKYNKSSRRYNKLSENLLPKISALKFLLSKTRQGYQKIPDVGQELYNIPTYVQPMDEYSRVKNLANQEYALEIAKKYNYILSLQMHKILDIE